MALLDGKDGSIFVGAEVMEEDRDPEPGSVRQTSIRACRTCLASCHTNRLALAVSDCNTVPMTLHTTRTSARVDLMSDRAALGEFVKFFLARSLKSGP